MNVKVDLKKIIDNLSNDDLVMGYKDKILTGVNYLGDMIKVTLGAKGKTVMFRNKQGKVVITKDGVTIAKECNSNDSVEQMAIEIVREASEKTVKSSGDGTTTTVILAQYLVNRGYELLQSGVSYYNLANGMDAAVDIIRDDIKTDAIKITEDSNFERLLDVATVSSNNKVIGEFVYDIMKDIGVYGAIEVKKSNNSKDRIDKVKGIKFNKGFYAPQFVNDLVKMQWRARGVHVVLYDDTIRTMSDIKPYIEEVGNDPILFIVNDVEPTVLQTIINNRLMNPTAFNIMIVEHDGFGDRKTEIMNDIAAMTSADICTSDYTGIIGYVDEVVVDADSCSMLGGHMNTDVVNELIDITKGLLANEDLDDSERLYYKRRLATLAGGVAVIHVGGTTEVEMSEKKDRIDDAVEAVKAAINRGVVIGGGYQMLKMQNWLRYVEFEHVMREGYNIVVESLSTPFEQLCVNAGRNPAEISKQLIMDERAMNNVGYDAITDTIVPLDEYKVYDPASVLIDAISNAVAVAKSILSIERVIGY